MERMTAAAKLYLEKRFRELVAKNEESRKRSMRSAEFTDAILKATVVGKISAKERGRSLTDVLRNMDLKIETGLPVKKSKPKFSDFNPKIEVIGPPYAGSFFNKSGHSDNSQNSSESTPVDLSGRFGFQLGTDGGSATGKAGLFIAVTDPEPLDQEIQILPFCPFAYQYVDNSSNGYTAHTNAIFEIQTFSFDASGDDMRPELDFSYPVWNDGTGWYEEHTNPSFDNFDADNAFEFDHVMPPFTAQATRSLIALISCSGWCDAGDGFFGNAVAAETLNATMPFVVLEKTTLFS
jgi:hypothetical protein